MAKEPDVTEDQCIAETSDGSRCKNPAKYPEEDPKFCGVHYDGDEEEEEKKNKDEPQPKSEGKRRVQVSETMEVVYN